MNLVQTLDNVPWCNLRFGLQRPMHYGLCGNEPTEDDLKGFVVTEHYRHLTHPDCQTLSSCESNSFCLIAEMWLKEQRGTSIQLDYPAIYARACDMYHMGEDNGLFLGESRLSAIDLKIVPPDTPSRTTDKTVAGICAELKDRPVQVGLSINEGFKASNLHPVNNAVDESFPAMPGNGHAMVVVAATIHNGVQVFVLANSWGGRYRLMCITPRHLLKLIISRPRVYPFPASFKDWEIPPRHILKAA